VIRRFLPLAALMALAACKTELAVNLYTADVQAVLETGTAVSTTAILSVPTGTEDKCRERSGDITPAVANGFDKTEFTGCRQSGMDSFADYRISIPIVLREAASRSALTIRILPGEGGSPAMVLLMQDAAAVDRIVSALPDDLKMFLSQIEPAISARVQNDAPATAAILVAGAFLDGNPIQLRQEIKIDRRSEVVIRLSDVANAALAANRSAIIYSFTPEP